jgi:nucleoside-diphosphate-sugar epimerase
LRVFVIGGTGFIGAAVVHQLREAAHEVALLQRPKSAAGAAGMLSLIGDYTSLPQLAEEVGRFGPDAIVDLSAMIGREAAVAFAALVPRCGRYVVASSGDVYANYGGLLRRERPFPRLGPLDEASELRAARYPYRGSKPRRRGDPQAFLDDYDKVLVEEAAQKHLGARGTILRLPMVYGPGNRRPRFGGILHRMADRRETIIVTPEHAAWRNTYGYVEDVASGIVAAALAEDAGGKTYNLGEPAPRRWRDWIEAFAGVLGWQGNIAEVPARGAPEHVAGLSMVYDMQYPLILDTTRARAELGYAELAPEDYALEQTARHELAAPMPAGLRPQDTYREEDRFLAESAGAIRWAGRLKLP